jgi:hypothetical protein
MMNDEVPDKIGVLSILFRYHKKSLVSLRPCLMASRKRYTSTKPFPHSFLCSVSMQTSLMHDSSFLVVCSVPAAKEPWHARYSVFEDGARTWIMDGVILHTGSVCGCVSGCEDGVCVCVRCVPCTSWTPSICNSFTCLCPLRIMYSTFLKSDRFVTEAA